MPKSLRSILGTSHRVKKTALSPRKPPATSRADQVSRSRPSTKAKTKSRTGSDEAAAVADDDDDDDDEFAAQLPDLGPITQLLLSDLSLRDVPQAMRYIRAHMFAPVPPSGLHSSRSTRTLAVRRGIPPLVTLGHVCAVLGDPSHVEREAAELWARGALRKVRVERRGGMGEALIEAGDLEGMVREERSGLSEAAKEGFIGFLRAHPTARTYPCSPRGGMATTIKMVPHGHGSGSRGKDRSGGARADAAEEDEDERRMSSQEVDELVRAGFLTSGAAVGDVRGLGGRLLMRPEDRTTLTSVERVSRHASGTVFAVGGRNAIHLAGGGGGGLASSAASASPSSGAASSTRQGPAPDEDGAGALRISVPGHGRYMKLAEGTVQWLRDLLATRRWGEGTEAWARERFEGGGLYGTRWKDFWGVEWEWVLGEAVGLGAVELFDTGSVGSGVRGLD